jgi:hypothetical protein
MYATCTRQLVTLNTINSCTPTTARLANEPEGVQDEPEGCMTSNMHLGTRRLRNTRSSNSRYVGGFSFFGESHSRTKADLTLVWGAVTLPLK